MKFTDLQKKHGQGEDSSCVLKYANPEAKMHTKLPSSARSTAPAPASPGFPFDAPSNSRVQKP